MLLVLQSQGGRGGGGGGPLPQSPAYQEPTPFERFVEKLKLDDKTQLPEVGKLFTAAATEAAPIAREMIQVRLRLIELDGTATGTAPALDAYSAASAKMTGIEARTFQQVYAVLKKDQQTRSAEAFLLMDGLLDVEPPRAARSGGVRGRGASGGSPARLALLTSLFTLDDGQKKQVKSMMDAEYKASASLRDAWTKSRAAVGAAIQSGQGAADIDQAVSRHAAQATAMAAVEMKALVKITAVLTAEQKTNAAAIQTAVYAMRRVFVGKKWDATPE